VFLVGLSVLQGLQAQALYEVSPLSFNTGYANEAAAVPYKDGVIFISDRRTHVLVSRIDTDDNPLYHLYHISRKDSSKWETPHVLYAELTNNAHQGPCTISADGNEMYFGLNTKNGTNIFYARKAGERWTRLASFRYNSPEYKNAHPSLSRDGKRLFFSSDMPGGYGGFDIYYCEKTPQGWGTPKNLGATVNTPKNDMYPFIQENGLLFFSSQGHQSLGGLDIFSVQESSDGSWGMLRHMEVPVNSEYNDFAYTASDRDGMEGYLASDRNGKNSDIFSFKSLFPNFPDCQQQIENDYTWVFYEPGSVDLDTTTFRYEWDMGDGTVKKGEEVEHTFATTGRYAIQLNVIDSLTNEVMDRVVTYMLDVLDEEQPYTSITGEPVTENNLTFDAAKTYLPNMDIEEYYWNFGDGIRMKGKSVEHIFTAPGTYQVQLGVTGTSKDTGETAKACSYLEVVIEQK
jgi:chitodextrinase